MLRLSREGGRLRAPWRAGGAAAAAPQRPRVRRTTLALCDHDRLRTGSDFRLVIPCAGSPAHEQALGPAVGDDDLSLAPCPARTRARPRNRRLCFCPVPRTRFAPSGFVSHLRVWETALDGIKDALRDPGSRPCHALGSPTGIEGRPLERPVPDLLLGLPVHRRLRALRAPSSSAPRSTAGRRSRT